MFPLMVQFAGMTGSLLARIIRMRKASCIPCRRRGRCFRQTPSNFGGQNPGDECGQVLRDLRGRRAFIKLFKANSFTPSADVYADPASASFFSRLRIRGCDFPVFARNHARGAKNPRSVSCSSLSAGEQRVWGHKTFSETTTLSRSGSSSPICCMTCRRSRNDRVAA